MSLATSGAKLGDRAPDDQVVAAAPPGAATEAPLDDVVSRLSSSSATVSASRALRVTLPDPGRGKLGGGGVYANSPRSRASHDSAVDVNSEGAVAEGIRRVSCEYVAVDMELDNSSDDTDSHGGHDDPDEDATTLLASEKTGQGTSGALKLTIRRNAAKEAGTITAYFGAPSSRHRNADGGPADADVDDTDPTEGGGFPKEDNTPPKNCSLARSPSQGGEATDAGEEAANEAGPAASPTKAAEPSELPPEAVNWMDNLICYGCKRDDPENDKLLLLCDGCNVSCHTFCHTPKLAAVPDGDWFCPTCASSDGKPRKPPGRYFSTEEDDRLKGILMSKECASWGWDEVAFRFPGRTRGSVYARYQRMKNSAGWPKHQSRPRSASEHHHRQEKRPWATHTESEDKGDDSVTAPRAHAKRRKTNDGEGEDVESRPWEQLIAKVQPPNGFQDATIDQLRGALAQLPEAAIEMEKALNSSWSAELKRQKESLEAKHVAALREQRECLMKEMEDVRLQVANACDAVKDYVSVHLKSS
mmetsp:Transcript_4813/g.12330  ORF Transcript_4813/g.12330 Transcript_4813/m.12330 type:complete len:530 (+) Transcript_4813:160-1749(+)